MTRLVAIAAAVLAVLSLALGSVDRFEPVGDNLLTNGDFEQGLDGWVTKPPRSDVSVRDGQLHLGLERSCPGGWCRSHAVQDFTADSPAYVRMTAKVRWKDVALSTDKRDRGPRLHLCSHNDGEDRVWHVAFHETSVDGTGEHTFVEDFHVWGKRSHWGVWLHFSGVEGEAWMDDVTLHRLGVATWWRLCFWLLVLGWTGLLGVVLWPAIRRVAHSVPHAGVVAVTAGILVGTLAPGDAMNPLRDRIAETASELVGPVSTPPAKTASDTEPKTKAGKKRKPKAVERGPSARTLIDKTSHFGAFLLLAVFATLAFGTSRSPELLAMGAVLGFAPVTEVMQGLTLGRSPRLVDVLVDVAGAVLGWGLVRIWRGRAGGDGPDEPVGD